MCVIGVLLEETFSLNFLVVKYLLQSVEHVLQLDRVSMSGHNYFFLFF